MSTPLGSNLLALRNKALNLRDSALSGINNNPGYSFELYRGASLEDARSKGRIVQAHGTNPDVQEGTPDGILALGAANSQTTDRYYTVQVRKNATFKGTGAYHEPEDVETDPDQHYYLTSDGTNFEELTLMARNDGIPGGQGTGGYAYWTLVLRSFEPYRSLQ